MIYDYYLGFSSREGIEWGKWNCKLRSLAIGESFTVDTDTKRRAALRSGQRIGVAVRSEKLASGGYIIFRINVCAPRKRGHPRDNQYED